MSVKTTSRTSYREHVLDGKARTQRERITELLEKTQEPWNRREISVVTEIPINAVCGRVKALIDSGELIVSYVAVDPSTNQRVEYLELPSKVLSQAEMF